MKTILSGINICKTFHDENVRVLDSINVTIYQGDFTVIMGASGAGKSTLLYALSGMDDITSGNILYDNLDMTKLNERQMARLRAEEFGFVFQSTHLVSNLTLLENILVAGFLNKRKDEKTIRKRALSLIEQMDIDAAKDRLPANVSGGEAQRAAIARAVINEPNLIFADEPTGALNKANTEEVLNLLSAFNKSGQSILMVTHDIHAAIYGNRILYLEDGRLAGEMSFPQFSQDEAKNRELQLSNWLSSLRW